MSLLKPDEIKYTFEGFDVKYTLNRRKGFYAVYVKSSLPMKTVELPKYFGVLPTIADVITHLHQGKRRLQQGDD